MTFPDDCSFPRLTRVLAASPYFHGRFLFQPIIRLIGPTTDSFLNDGFLLQNYGPDPPIKKRSSLEISQNSQENTYVRVSFCQGLKPATLFKKDSGTGVFL